MYTTSQAENHIDDTGLLSTGDLRSLYHSDLRGAVMKRSEEKALFHRIEELQAKLEQDDLEQAEAARINREVNDLQWQAVCANIGLVVNIAKKHNHRGLPLQALIQEGLIGFHRGVERFDYHRGFKLCTYAGAWARQAIGRAVADQGRTIRLPVHMHDQVYKSLSLIQAYQMQTGDAVDSPEVLAQLWAESGKKISCDRAALHLELAPNPSSLDEGIGEAAHHGDQEYSLYHVIPDETDGVEIEAEKSIIAERLRAVIETLPAREEKVLRLRYGLDDGNPMTLQEIAVKFGITRERIRQIEADALKKLRHPSRARKLRGVAT